MLLLTAMWHHEIVVENWSYTYFVTVGLTTVKFVLHRYGTHGTYLVMRSLSSWIQQLVRSSPESALHFAMSASALGTSSLTLLKAARTLSPHSFALSAVMPSSE